MGVNAYGSSAIFVVYTGYPGATPAALTGLSSFTIASWIPDPSLFAVFGLGALQRVSSLLAESSRGVGTEWRPPIGGRWVVGILKGCQNAATPSGSMGDCSAGGPGVSLRLTPGYSLARARLAKPECGRRTRQPAAHGRRGPGCDSVSPWPAAADLRRSP